MGEEGVEEEGEGEVIEWRMYCRIEGWRIVAKWSSRGKKVISLRS